MMQVLEVFDETFFTFLAEIDASYERLKTIVIWILGAITTFQAILLLVKYAFFGKADETVMQLFLKIVFLWILVFSFPYIASTLKWTFIRFGAIGSGSSILNSPSKILIAGWDAGSHIINGVTNFINEEEFQGGNFQRTLTIIKVIFINLPKMGIGLILWLVVMACYTLIMTQVFLAYIEFAILTAVGVILLPFGIFKFTSFLNEKLIGSILGHGLKLLLLQFVIGIGINIFAREIIPSGTTVSDITYLQLFAITVNAIIFAILVMSVPNMAVGILSGQPTLSGSAIQQGAIVGSSMVNGAKNFMNRAGATGGFVARGGASVAGGLRGTAGAASGGGGKTPSGLMAQAGSGLTAFARSAGGGMRNSAVPKGREVWRNLTDPKQEGIKLLPPPGNSKVYNGLVDHFRQSTIAGHLQGRTSAEKKE